MAHFFSEGGFTVLHMFSYRLQIVDRNRNPILKQTVFPCFQEKEFRIGKYAIKFSKV